MIPTKETSLKFSSLIGEVWDQGTGKFEIWCLLRPCFLVCGFFVIPTCRERQSRPLRASLPMVATLLLRVWLFDLILSTELHCPLLCPWGWDFVCTPTFRPWHNCAGTQALYFSSWGLLASLQTPAKSRSKNVLLHLCKASHWMSPTNDNTKTGGGRDPLCWHPRKPGSDFCW